MERIALALLALALSAPTLAAQETGTPLTAGQVHADSLTADGVHAFTLDLEADQFVLGEADQRTVDVVITVYGPDDERLTATDISARGPELFQFDAEAAGRYRVEVESFEQQSGSYTLVIRRVEPLATRPEARVDQLMAAYDGNVPGGVIGVVQAGELVFAKGYGMASLTYGVRFGVDTRNNIGSTSKQFTAFAIALLAERGELSLDDDVREHIPELPAFDDTVRIRHLLTHTSGYREFLNALALTGRRLDQGDYIARSEVIDLVQRQPALQNRPGEEFNYNNTGYSLLTVVVERVTGQPFPEWMAENVFRPLGMEGTLVRAHPGQVVRNSARGFMPSDEDASGWREVQDLSASMGAGGIYTTVADLARWMANFRNPRVGSADIFPLMTTRNVLATGDTTDYGLGLFVDEYLGLDRVHHGGADLAHRSMLLYFPAIDAGVIAQSNNATFNYAAMANDVAKAFFAEHLELEEDEEPAGQAVAGTETFDPESYDPERFDPLAGSYELEVAPGFILSFFREDDTLFTQATGQPRVRIEPTSDSTFRLLVVEASVTFHRNPDGTADSLTLHQNGHHVAHRVEKEAWEPSADELEAYTGRYLSAELQTFYEIALEDDALTLDHRRFEQPVKLTPAEEPGAFRGTFPVAEAKFIRNEAGEVIALEVSNGRTRGVRFDRVELAPSDSNP